MPESAAAGAPPARLTADELAALVGDTVARVDELTALGVLVPDQAGTYDPGDAHRVRVVDGFEAAGVPLDALVKAQDAGVLTVAYYDDLHGPPGHPSERSYGTFRDSLGTRRALVPALFGAFGIAEPDETMHLSIEDEAFIDELATVIESTGHVDLALQIARQFGEATRRASVGSLEVYTELIDRLGPSFVGVPTQEVYDRHFLPWTRLARAAPAMAEWLASNHLSRAIDDYSIRSSEAVLEDLGFVPRRPDRPPAVAFIDLTGFTTLTQQIGDARAAEIALKLAGISATVATAHGGRLVKLLGDGVLLRLPGLVEAVDSSLAVLEALEAANLPRGHAGISDGPVIARDGDVFGRTVNLAARLADEAPSGEVYLPAVTAGPLADHFIVEPVGAHEMEGIGEVELVRIVRRGGSGVS